jgi:hypothetical protein
MSGVSLLPRAWGWKSETPFSFSTQLSTENLTDGAAGSVKLCSKNPNKPLLDPKGEIVVLNIFQEEEACAATACEGSGLRQEGKDW